MRNAMRRCAFTTPLVLITALTCVTEPVLTGAADPAPVGQVLVRPRMVLRVLDRSGMPDRTVAAALTRAVRIFDAAGVSVTTAGLREAAMAATAVDPARVLHLTLLRHAPDAFHPLPATVLGAVVQPLDGEPAAVVLAARVERLATNHDVDAGALLGHVIAHEIGHLLLPPGHGALGLMQENWSDAAVQQASRGQLRFSDRERTQLHAALGAGAPAAARR